METPIEPEAQNVNFALNSPAQSNPDDTKTIVTVVLLFFFFPVGIVMMWVWTSWKKSIKVLITVLGCLPFVIGIIIFVLAVMYGLMSPTQVSNDTPSTVISTEELNQCMDSCQIISSTNGRSNCIANCLVPAY